LIGGNEWPLWKLKTAVLSKLSSYPVTTPGLAQGRQLAQPLGNLEEGIILIGTPTYGQGKRWLAIRMAIEFMCQEAVQTVFEPGAMGLPFFPAHPDGRIANVHSVGHTIILPENRFAVHVTQLTGPGHTISADPLPAVHP